jgi:uncharacterized membrane protein YqaE (UPF0057 family)
MDDSVSRFFLVILFIALYFIPGLIAQGRHQRNANAATNLLLGWTVLGWIIAFIWAFTHPGRSRE